MSAIKLKLYEEQKMEINGAEIHDGDILGTTDVDYFMLNNEELSDLLYMGKGRIQFSYHQEINIWYVTNIDDPQRSTEKYKELDAEAIRGFVKL